MGYVIAAYGVTIAALGAYLIHLARERSRLVREHPDGRSRKDRNSG